MCSVRKILTIAIAVFMASCTDGSDIAPGAVLSGELLALTYNVAGLPQPLSGSNPEQNMPIISPLLNGYDLVLVQEDWETPEPNTIAPLRVYHDILVADALHPYQSDSAPLPVGMNPVRPSALVSDGLNRLSQFPFGQVVRQGWSDCDNNSGDCLAMKGFSVARTELSPGVCVDVYNVHGEAGNNEGDRAIKAVNTQELIDFMTIFSADRAVILGGDFNLRLRREADAENLALLVQETGVTNACAALGIIDEEAIDKFFFRSNWSLELHPTSCGFENDVFVTDSGEPLSDHDALAVGFVWSASPVSDIDCLW